MSMQSIKVCMDRQSILGTSEFWCYKSQLTLLYSPNSSAYNLILAEEENLL